MAKTYLRTGRISWSPLTTAQQAMLANVNGIAIGSTFSATLDSPTETFLIGNGVISFPTSPVVASSGDTVGNVPVDNGDGTYSWTTPSGGSGSPGAPVYRAFPFTFDTPGLLTGHTLFTATIGDVLINAWFEIDTPWDGTTPLADVGVFTSFHFGMFGNAGQGAVDLSAADQDNLVDSNGLLAQGNAEGTHNNDLWQSAYASGGGAHRYLPARFAAASVVKLCVSQDGSITGADPGATQGSAVLHIVTVTPTGPI